MIDNQSRTRRAEAARRSEAKERRQTKGKKEVKSPRVDSPNVIIIKNVIKPRWGWPAASSFKFVLGPASHSLRRRFSTPQSSTRSEIVIRGRNCPQSVCSEKPARDVSLSTFKALLPRSRGGCVGRSHAKNVIGYGNSTRRRESSVVKRVIAGKVSAATVAELPAEACCRYRRMRKPQQNYRA